MNGFYFEKKNVTVNVFVVISKRVTPSLVGNTLYDPRRLISIVGRPTTRG